MAVTGFTTSNFLRTTTTPITGKPITLSIWCNPNSTSTMRLFEWADNATTNNLARINFSGSNQVTGTYNNGGSAVTVSTTGTVSVGSWTHACAVFAGSSALSYINGTAAPTPAVIGSDPTGVDRFGVGISATGGAATAPFDGLLERACVWNMALTQSDISALAAGADPFSVQPANLVCYWRLLTTTDITNLVTPGTHDLTLTGSLSNGGSSPTIYDSPLAVFSGQSGLGSLLML